MGHDYMEKMFVVQKERDYAANVFKVFSQKNLINKH
jgi:hypothetical protein